MEDKKLRLMSLSYDTLYDLKSKLNNRFSSKIDIFLEDLEKEAKEWGYEFKLCDRTQKFKLYKLK